MRHLILASGSIYRKQLLESAGYLVHAVPSGVLEPDLSQFGDLESSLIYLATLKARAVLTREYTSICEQTETPLWILAADTISLVGGDILGKPHDRQDARQMLEKLSNGTHDVLTGWCLLRRADQLAWTGVERTEITMRQWTTDEIEKYLDSGQWEGKCGAYGLEWPDDPYVMDLQGSASNVIGVPLERLNSLWQEFHLDMSP